MVIKENFNKGPNKQSVISVHEFKIYISVNSALQPESISAPDQPIQTLDLQQADLVSIIKEEHQHSISTNQESSVPVYGNEFTQVTTLAGAATPVCVDPSSFAKASADFAFPGHPTNRLRQDYDGQAQPALLNSSSFEEVTTQADPTSGYGQISLKNDRSNFKGAWLI